MCICGFIPDLLVAPQKVKISMSLVSPALVIAWSYPVQAIEASYTPPTHFVILIDEVECCRVEAKHDIRDEDTISMKVEVTQDDIVESGIELSMELDHQLIVRSLAANQQSKDSEAVLLTPDLVTRLLNSQMAAVVTATARKDNSLSPVDNSVVHVPPVAKPRGMYLSSPSGDMSSTDDNEDSSDGDDVEIFSPVNRSIRENHGLLPAGNGGGLTNGTVITSAGSQTRNIHDQGTYVMIICMFLYVCQSICRSVRMSVSLSVCLSVHLCVCVLVHGNIPVNIVIVNILLNRFN